jgi:hypothetical protein
LEQGAVFFVRSSAVLTAALILAWAGSSFPVFAVLLEVLGFSVSAWLFLREVRLRLEVERFCRALARESPVFSDLLSAVELSRSGEREGVSSALRQALIDSVQFNLDRESPERWIAVPQRKKRLQSVALSAGVLLSLFLAPPGIGLSGWNRLFFGDRAELARHLRIDPAGGAVPYGEPAFVSVELLNEDRPVPRLYVRSSSGWEPVSGVTSGKQTVFSLQAVTEPVRYKIRWKDLESRAYVLTPVDPLRLSDFRVEVHAPAYAGQPVQVIEGEPQLQILRGTRLEISARASLPLESAEAVTSLGTKIPVRVEGGKNLKLVLPVQNPFEFWFELQSKTGARLERPVHYAVGIKDDASPRVRLLAPASDLIAGGESVLPFTYELKDDLGVQSIYLQAEDASGGNRRRILLKRYQPALSEKIDTSEFDLSALQASPGQLFRLRLEVLDGDTVSGPKSGLSDSILLEIQSYEKEHARLEQELQTFRKDLLDLLAEQTLSRVPDKEWKSLSADPAALNRRLEESARKQSQVRAQAESVSRRLEQSLRRMERDPLSDGGLLGEYQALLEGLDFVREESMGRAVDKLQSKDWAGAVEAQDRASSELERLSSLSEEMDQYGKMKDLMHSAERLESKAARIGRDLESGAPGPEALRAVQETLQEAMGLLSQIQKQIKELPQELPEEFVNQAAVKQMDLQSMSDSARKIGEAVRRGDVRSALEAAQELLKQVKQAREALSKASDAIDFSGGGNLGGESGEKDRALQKIVERQEQILQRTGVLESKRVQARLEAQKKILEELSARQSRAVESAVRLREDLGRLAPPPGYSAAVQNQLNTAIPKMEKVLKEFRGLNVLFSQKWLEEIAGEIAAGERSVAAAIPDETPAVSVSSTAPPVSDPRAEEAKAFHERTLALALEEQSILDTLRKPPEEGPSPFSSEDREEMKKLDEEQAGLSQETGRLESELSKLAAKSALLGPDILESVESARKEMGLSSQSLREARTEAAQEHQQKVLSELRQGQEDMQKTMEQMGQMKAGGSGSSGAGQPGFFQTRGGTGNAGEQGVRRGAVKIPRAEDYLPPRQFREEILESLKERYPKSQESVIKDYYKKLTE